MSLIESFTVIRVSAAPDFSATPEFHFNKPVGIGKRLTRQPGDISLSSLQITDEAVEPVDRQREIADRYTGEQFDLHVLPLLVRTWNHPPDGACAVLISR